MDDNITLAVLSAKLDDIKNDVDSLRKDMSDFQKIFLTRNEWMLRNQLVDDRFSGLGREIGELRLNLQEKAAKNDLIRIRQELDAKHAPWWSVAAIVISGISLIYTTIIIP